MSSISAIRIYYKNLVRSHASNLKDIFDWLNSLSSKKLKLLGLERKYSNDNKIICIDMKHIDYVTVINRNTASNVTSYFSSFYWHIQHA